MNPMLQIALIVVIGTPICAFGTLGMLLLCMRLQGTSRGNLDPGKQNAVRGEATGVAVQVQR